MIGARISGSAVPLFITVFSLAISAGDVSAATFTVNTLVDESDGVGVGGVSLRDAINAANGAAGDDIIAFSVTGTISLLADLPNITSNIVIDGPGAASLTVHGADTFRAFVSFSVGISVIIRNLSVSHCRAVGGAGGRSGIAGGGGGGAAGMGPGLFVNNGSVRLEGVTLSTNSAVGGAGGNTVSGIFNGGGGGGGVGTAGQDSPSGGGNGGTGGFLGGIAGAAGGPPTSGGDGGGGGGGDQQSSGVAGASGGFAGGGGGAGSGSMPSPRNGGAGGFGAGGGGPNIAGGTIGAGGLYAGNSGNSGTGANRGGGGGAGLGGAVFVRGGRLILSGCTFSTNSAVGGAAGTGAQAGHGKGGAIFINTGAIVEQNGSNYSGNSAANAGSTATDDNDVLVLGVLGSFPTVTSITRVGPSPTNATSVAFNVTFSESVTGFEVNDLVTITSGTLSFSRSVTGGGAAYLVTFTSVSGNGTLDMGVADNDSIVNAGGIPLGGTGAGNGDFSGSDPFNIDQTAPTVTSITPSTTGPTNATSVDFSVVFCDVVTGFDGDDVTVNHSGTASTAKTVGGSGTTYVVTIGGLSGTGSFTVSIPAGGAIDAAGNGNAIGNPSAAVSVDRVAPSVTGITPSTTGPTNATSVDLSVFFSESVSGFDAGDFTVLHAGTANSSSSVTGSGASYTITIGGLSGAGSFTVSIPAGVAADASGNANTAGGPSAEITIDQVAPTVTEITPASTALTNETEAAFTVTFSKAVTGFDAASDVTVSHTGTTSTGVTIAPVSATQYTVTVGGLAGSGSFTLSVVAGGCHDAVGNPCAAGGPSAAVIRTPATGGGGGSSAGPCGLGACGPTSLVPLTMTLVCMRRWRSRRGIQL